MNVTFIIFYYLLIKKQDYCKNIIINYPINTWEIYIYISICLSEIRVSQGENRLLVYRSREHESRTCARELPRGNAKAETGANDLGETYTKYVYVWQLR